MKDINTILAEMGVEIPDDKKDAFEAAHRENYKTVNEVNKITSARDALKAQVDSVQQLLDTKTAEYDSLKAAAGDNSELKSTVDKLKSDFEQEKNTLKENYEKQLKTATVAARITADYRPRDVGDVMNHIDLEKISVDGDKITGLSEQVEPLKESRAYYFEEEYKRSSGLDHSQGGGNDYSAIRRAMGLKDKKE